MKNSFIKTKSLFRFFLLSAIMFGANSAFTQQRNGYLNIDAAVYAFKNDDPAIGAHFGGNAGIANDVYLGAELGVVKFHDNDKVYLPVLARFSFMPQVNSKKANLIVLIAPGYGAYNNSYRDGNNDHKVKGGFAFFGGLGAGFKGKRNGYLTLTVGYTSFGFDDRGSKYNVDGVGIRVGGMFR
jgi:hypothetical protein